MKKIFLSLAMLACITTFAQKNKQVCCSKPAEGSLSMWINKEGFHEAHLNPEPLNYNVQSGETYTFKTPDGTTGTAFSVKQSENPGKVIIMVHEWWGLNDYIKREAETLSKELNVDVYAVDLYDGKVAATSDSAGKLMGGLKPQRASNIIKGLITSLGPKTQIATLGWCMGGSWSFQAALIGGNQIKGCVMYYGFPEKDPKKMKALNSDVLYIDAEKDSFITPEAKTQFTKDLITAGKKITVKKYNAVHAFANPSNPNYNKDFSEDAHKIVLDYLSNRLKL